jgi:hypothetical protein
MDRTERAAEPHHFREETLEEILTFGQKVQTITVYTIKLFIWPLLRLKESYEAPVVALHGATEHSELTEEFLIEVRTISVKCVRQNIHMQGEREDLL